MRGCGWATEAQSRKRGCLELKARLRQDSASEVLTKNTAARVEPKVLFNCRFAADPVRISRGFASGDGMTVLHHSAHPPPQTKKAAEAFPLSPPTLPTIRKTYTSSATLTTKTYSKRCDFAFTNLVKFNGAPPTLSCAGSILRRFRPAPFLGSRKRQTKEPGPRNSKCRNRGFGFGVPALAIGLGRDDKLGALASGLGRDDNGSCPSCHPGQGSLRPPSRDPAHNRPKAQNLSEAVGAAFLGPGSRKWARPG